MSKCKKADVLLGRRQDNTRKFYSCEIDYIFRKRPLKSNLTYRNVPKIPDVELNIKEGNIGRFCSKGRSLMLTLAITNYSVNRKSFAEIICNIEEGLDSLR